MGEPLRSAWARPLGFVPASFPPPPTVFAVPAGVRHQVLSLIGDVRGEGCQPIHDWKHLEVAIEDKAHLAIAVDSAGRIYIVTGGKACNGRINDMSGAGWATMGTGGTAFGQFNVPSQIAV